ncbi:MAG: protein kinase [Gemmataceae bacterium]|nr:protein kinase [Gemmataceae bacterium]MCI0741865.1 protein kinase [Gemmataceae bacterium]
MSTDVVTFVNQLRTTQLLSAPQQAEADRLAQTAARPAALASELVKRGWITPYQANQIARGRGSELVLGSYTVLEPLGRGGMGQVVRARHRFLNRDVALKLIRRDQRDDPDTLQRFQREVSLLAQLRHPHIVQAHDAGYVNDAWFLAMELLVGIDLERLVKQRGPLQVGEACEFIRQGAQGLQHAHERGLVHRDIKPSNLFLTIDGIKLLDLGLARPQTLPDGELTHTNAMMGTPDYLAPEQALDPRRADARSDLYALGCTLYFLLTGAPPFPGGTITQKLLLHQQSEPTRIDILRPDVPAELVSVVRRLLAKSPQARPASAAETGTLLAPFAAPTNGVLASTPTVPQGQWEASGKPPSMPQASLIEGNAGTSERGFTLTTEESVASAATPSASMSYERGWTLTAESVAPSAAAPVSLAPAAVVPTVMPVAAAAPAETRAQLRLPIVLGIAGAAVLLIVLLIVMLQGQGNLDANPSAKDKPKRPAVQVDPPKILAEVGPHEKPDPSDKPFDFDPRLQSPSADGKVYLTDLHGFAQKGSPDGWKFGKNGRLGDEQNTVIQLGKEVYLKGLGTHPPFWTYFRVCYALGKKASSFHGAVGLADHKGWGPHPTRFSILGDDKVRWRSQLFKERSVSEAFNLDVKDVNVLELRVYCETAFSHGSHAVWLDPYVFVD